MQTSKQRQQSISSVINMWLKKIVNASSLSQYKQMLNNMSDEAAKNGLTPEKPEQMLKEND